MDNNEIVSYILENERKRYEYAKELQRTIRWAIFCVAMAITVCVCCYMYYVVPVEEVVVDGNSNAAINTVVDNGGQIWQ